VRTWRSHFYGWLSGHLFRGKYPQPRYAFDRQFEASGKYNCTDRLDEITIPTVVMHGKKDRSAPYAVAEEMHRLIGGSQMVTFSGGHLFFLLRERQQFLEAVTRFLDT
jgi:pimeloyl-ACP methyl ester carboxylesterase